MITKILIILAVLIGLFLIVAAFQPSDFRITRSTQIAAPASVVFAQANDLRLYQVWNPWGKHDLAAKYTFEGPSTGPGASMTWVGNSKVGEGRMTIVESRPNDVVKTRLDFLKPFASVCQADFSFKEEGGKTQVIWSMSGPKNFMSKAMGLVMNMDKMIGGEFEKGLASLKGISEGAAAK